MPTRCFPKADVFMCRGSLTFFIFLNLFLGKTDPESPASTGSSVATTPLSPRSKLVKFFRRGSKTKQLLWLRAWCKLLILSLLLLFMLFMSMLMGQNYFHYFSTILCVSFSFYISFVTYLSHFNNIVRTMFCQILNMVTSYRPCSINLLVRNKLNK